ncbi:hypothetical protein GCM10022243_06190 [Saccharothrix violaceirubra]|uniref:SH3 domain-containing protein n=1 Tax=Saccharothrix violaceirubra TaxID=413306 RepID=A0A7W7WTB2_9PSEU|nr:SH3 domain-containing protein [Saccharothrix violaceirubra]MBB4963031.1 hypothetical protein [Saccharothrix violaceirubra]
MFGIPTRGLLVIGVLGTAGLLYLGKGVESTPREAASCRVAVVADVLNVRSGPSDAQPVVATLRRDAVVAAERQVVDGFRLLGDGRWVKDEYVLPTSDSAC